MAQLKDLIVNGASRLNGLCSSSTIEGGTYIKGTHEAAFNVTSATNAAAGSYYQGWYSGKTSSGAWSIGSLSGGNDLYFIYGTDANYTNANNSFSRIRFTSDGKVYNAVWNDYAELFKTLEPISPHYIAYQTKDGVKSSGDPKTCVGVISDSYGHLLGGEGTTNDPNYVPIGLAGRVKLVVDNINKIEIGDFIAATDCGIGRKAALPDDFGCVLGKCTNIFDNDTIEILITMI